MQSPSRSQNGIALIITLTVLVLITITVVGYITIARLEGTSARSALDAERAKLFGDMALNDVAAKLRDNITTDKPWAAAPGRLCVLKNNAWSQIALHSGLAAGSTTGTVSLNSPIVGETSKYPIVPKNNEFPNPDPMTVAWINVLQDGTRSIDSGYNPTQANPIVGRYAYWVDTETSKVNLNTAGKAQKTYSFNSGLGDMQNLTAHPSRVDLSQLDSAGGAISSALSLATYNYTCSSFWWGAGDNHDQLSGVTSAPSPRASGQGGGRFNSIDDWVAITGITSDMVEANKFSLTTRAWAPELNPWGLNKLWLQSNAPQLGLSSNPANVSYEPGNKLDGASPTPPASGLEPSTDGRHADYSYYVYPVMRGANASGSAPDLLGVASPGSLQLNLQWIGPSAIYHQALTSRWAYNTFIHNMIYQMQRKDWPGMPPVSFVDKYGLQECEDLAYNMLILYDSAINYGGYVPGNILAAAYYTGPDGRDPVGLYGGCFYAYSPSATQLTPTATSPGGRLIPRMGPFPQINEVAVQFTPTTAGFTPSTITGTDGTVTTFPIPGYSGDSTTGTLLVTKDGTRPGFCPPIDAAHYGTNYKNYTNVVMLPQIELYYPASLANSTPFVTRNGGGGLCNLGMCDIEVTATGQFNGAPVTYTGSNFIWGYPDDLHYTNVSGCGFPLSGGTANVLIPSDAPWSQRCPSIYIGPFDKATTPSITIKFRAFANRMNTWTLQPALALVPLGWSYPSSPASETNDTSGTKLDFTVTNLDLSLPISTFRSLEVCDPRVSRYRSDWQPSQSLAGHTLGLPNSVYVASYPDPLTGITGDSSKLAWPDIEAEAASCNQLGSDKRWRQNAGNITGFPGIGWLSVLPTNLETSGTWDSSETNRTATGAPIPWRTLSLEPSTKASQLPDWLLLEAFALAYEHSFLSQSEGKININADISPFGFNRLAPLKALLTPSASNSSTSAAPIAFDLASHVGANSGPCGSLPSDIYIYPSQICQVSSMAGNGANQFQREALMRDVAGLITTSCSDFKVHALVQSVKQKAFTGDLSRDLSVTGQQRIEATVSRIVDVGPDQVPGTSDDMAGPDQLVGTADDLKFTAYDGSPITKLNYNATDKPLEGFAGRPPFKYQINDYKILRQ